MVVDSTLSDNESVEGSLQRSGSAIQDGDPDQFTFTPQAATHVAPDTGTPLAAFSEVSQQTTLPAPEYVATTESHVGRSDYLGDGDVRFREEMVQARSDHSRLSATDFELLQVQKAFELPQRSVHSSLIDNYWKYCSPWTPILEPAFVEKHETDGTSPLLLNALFLAGSRVSSSKILSTLAEDFYRKARLLFMLGHEQDTLTSIIAVTLLQWYNPTGPEHISTSTSGFWVRIAAGMAYQVGLHREPVTQKDRSLRRRLWWSIVVGIFRGFLPVTSCLLSCSVGMTLSQSARVDQEPSTLQTATSLLQPFVISLCRMSRHACSWHSLASSAC